ncbi:MAG TPA: hypothetical protein VKQ30_01920 [Ktedonobacterales bacterium]|nr:hypothetical protein [Ktedonobacterales bacterium]
MRDNSHFSHGAVDRNDTAKRRTLMDGATGRQRVARRAAAPHVLDMTPPQGTRTYYAAADDPNTSDRRFRDRTAARPLAQAHVPRWTIEDQSEGEEPDEQEYVPRRSDASHSSPGADFRSYQLALAPRPVPGRVFVPARRPRLDTRALVRRARSPWSLTRTLLAVIALTVALWTAVAYAGEPSQPLMADSWRSVAGAHVAQAITSLVQPETQGMRPDLYDTYAQFNDWWDAACSAAVTSEVLTAWGVPHATIGKLIDAMKPDISLNGGLLTPHGFTRGAAAFGYRADIGWHLTYNQMKYITNVLGLPIIVNVRISYGYYHFFSGGHFLVMTGGDDQGLRIVDSSEYYIHYLPKDTFDSMFTGMTAVIAPDGYEVTVPSI